MEGLVIDILREILTHLEAKDLCLAASVNKIWCYESNSSILWRALFIKFYASFVNDHYWDEKDKKLAELIRTTPTQNIYHDWKRAYMIKYKCNNATQNRVLCLSTKCMTAHSTPMLDKHDMESFVHQPLMFERFATQLLETDKRPPSDEKREYSKPTPRNGLFKKVCKMLGKSIGRAWMVLNASRSEDLAERLNKESNSIFTTLMGSFFNLGDMHNFPYLVKVDSCLTFCEYVFDTSGGEWCYIMVEHPSLQEHIDYVWYLNIDMTFYPNKDHKTMAFLRRHFMKIYTWFESFWRLGEVQNIILLLHVYEQIARDELFFEILSHTGTNDNNAIRTHVVDYFILVDYQRIFFSKKIAKIGPDFVPKKIDMKAKKGDASKITDYLTTKFLLSSQKFIKKYYPLTKTKDLIPRLRKLYEQTKEYGFVSQRDVTRYFLFYYTDSKWDRKPGVKEILNDQGLEPNVRIDRISDILYGKEKEKESKS